MCVSIEIQIAIAEPRCEFATYQMTVEFQIGATSSAHIAIQRRSSGSRRFECSHCCEEVDGYFDLKKRSTCTYLTKTK